MYLKLAWRNIWRNKRRTLISIFSIFLAVSLSIFIKSQYLGSYESMMRNIVGSFLGYIQIQSPKYAENPSLKNTFEDKADVKLKIKSVDAIKNIVPRLELNSFVGSQDKKKVAFLLGIDIHLEQNISNPKKRLLKGFFFTKNTEQAVILAENLAKLLKLDIGDSLEIIGKDFYTKPVLDKFLIKGIVKIPPPKLNQKLVYIPLKTCQNLFKTQNRISSYVLDLDNFTNTQKISQKIQKRLIKDKLKASSWEKSNPDLQQILLVQNIASNIVIFVLYMIVGFGIFGTILMMFTERRTEFKTLISIGLKKQKLAFMLFIEIVILTLLGVLISNLLISPLIFYLHYKPIQVGGEMAQMMQEVGMPAKIYYAIHINIFLQPSLLIFLMTSILALYVFRYIKRIQLVI